MKVIVHICRILLGLVFIFSGFVKAVDPIGFQYKLVDYFVALNINWLSPFALFLSFSLIGLEFLLGFTLLFNVKFRLSYIFSLLLMVVFTPLTLWLAISNKVSDCGCFGDAIPLTNWQTFYKNVIIDLVLIFVIIFRNKITAWLSNKKEWIMIGIFALLILGFEFYNYLNLPVIDFRPYKIGNNLAEQMKMPEGAKSDKFMVIYSMKNAKTGELKEINSEDYLKTKIWQDTTWKIEKTSEPVLVEKGYTPPIHDFKIVDENGNDLVDSVLQIDSYCFLLVMYDLENSNKDGILKANKIHEWAKSNNLGFYAITSASKEEQESLKKTLNLGMNFYTCDPITMKTIIRSNPGLVLLKKGTVIDHWHHRKIPSPEKMKTKLGL